MKKIFLVCLTAFVLVLSMTGCNDTKTEKDDCCYTDVEKKDCCKEKNDTNAEKHEQPEDVPDCCEGKQE